MGDATRADVAQPDQARIVGINAQYFLKNSGNFVISIKASCIDSTAPPEAVFAREVCAQPKVALHDARFMHDIASSTVSSACIHARATPAGCHPTHEACTHPVQLNWLRAVLTCTCRVLQEPKGCLVLQSQPSDWLRAVLPRTCLACCRGHEHVAAWLSFSCGGRAQVKKLQEQVLKPREQVTLEPYERDHAMVVGVYRPPPKKKP